MRATRPAAAPNGKPGALVIRGRLPDKMSAACVRWAAANKFPEQPGVPSGQHDRPFGPPSVHDCDHVVHLLLEGSGACPAGQQPGAALVEVDHPAERGQAPQVVRRCLVPPHTSST